MIIIIIISSSSSSSTPGVDHNWETTPEAL